MFPDARKNTGLNDRSFSDFPSFPHLSPLGELLSLGSAKGKEEKVKQEELARELDERSARIRTLREAEVEARECGLHARAEEYKKQRLAEEPGYGLAYRKLCRSRPAVGVIPPKELSGTGVS